MSKQRFTQFTAIGFIGFFLVLALTSLPAAGQATDVVAPDNQPQPVAAPTAFSAPAKATPSPASAITQRTIQPAPQPAPTPASAAEKYVIPATSSKLPVLLLGLLMGGTVVLLLGFAIRLRPRHTDCPTILAEGVHA